MGRMYVPALVAYVLLIIAAAHTTSTHSSDAPGLSDADTAGLHHLEPHEALHSGGGSHRTGRTVLQQRDESGGSGTGDGSEGGAPEASKASSPHDEQQSPPPPPPNEQPPKQQQQQQQEQERRQLARATTAAGTRTQMRHRGMGQRPLTEPTAEERARAEQEEQAARVVGMILFIIVAGQYGLYAWKRRALGSYQRATLAGLWLFPACFATYFHLWKFVVAWLLYSLSTGRYVALTRRRPLPKLAPRRVYTWFNGMHRLSHFLVLLGYFIGLADFMDLNPASVLLLAVFPDPANSLHAPFPAQKQLHEARMDAYHAATAKAHAHHVAGLPSNVERGEVDLGFELPDSPTHEHAKVSQYVRQAVSGSQAGRWCQVVRQAGGVR